tara:strand:+ start:362 stop:559 length:198 start_codon:yes stop_codon:yes gene_type:complete
MIDPNPFANFHPDKADKLLEFAESICVDEIDAAAHLAACLMGLVPRKEVANAMLDYVEHQHQQIN